MGNPWNTSVYRDKRAIIARTPDQSSAISLPNSNTTIMLLEVVAPIRVWDNAWGHTEAYKDQFEKLVQAITRVDVLATILPFNATPEVREADHQDRKKISMKHAKGFDQKDRYCRGYDHIRANIAAQPKYSILLAHSTERTELVQRLNVTGGSI